MELQNIFKIEMIRPCNGRNEANVTKRYKREKESSYLVLQTKESAGTAEQL